MKKSTRCTAPVRRGLEPHVFSHYKIKNRQVRFSIMCRGAGSNRRLFPLQGNTLPTELPRHNYYINLFKTIIKFRPPSASSGKSLTGTVHLSPFDYKTLKILRLGPKPNLTPPTELPRQIIILKLFKNIKHTL